MTYSGMGCYEMLYPFWILLPRWWGDPSAAEDDTRSIWWYKYSSQT